MDKDLQDKFNKLLNKYKALSHERLEVETEITKRYETLIIKNTITIASKAKSTLQEIMNLRERLDTINREMKKIDKKIMKLLQ